jgi:Tol biopolymer transport system component
MIPRFPFLGRSARRRFATPALVAVLVGASVLPAAADPPGDPGCTSSWADGTGLVWVVFCSDQDGAGDLYEREPDGDIERLTDIATKIGQTLITPDGSAVVFEVVDTADDVTQIYRLDRTAEGPRPLTSEGSNRNPVLDPSGRGIVFVSDRDGAAALWSMTIDGADQRPLFLASVE